MGDFIFLSKEKMGDNLNQILQNHQGSTHDMNHMNHDMHDVHEMHDGNVHEGHDMMMMMYFYFGYENVQMIIKNWIIDNIPDMVGSCTGLFLIAIIFEFLKVFRDVKTQELNKQFEKKEPRFEDSQSGLEDDHHERENRGSEQPLLNQKKSPFAVFGNKIHILLSFTYFLQQFISTCLMLIFMTFNMYLILSITLVMATGYYLTGFIRIAHQLKLQEQDCC